MEAIFQTVIVMPFCFAGAVEAATTPATLEEAIKRGDTLEQIAALFDEGPEVNYKVTLLPGKEPAPLICALADDAVYGYSDEYKGLDLPYNQAEAMEALLDNGADPNARDAQGRTPLSHPEQYNILAPEDSGVYYLAQWPSGINKVESVSTDSGNGWYKRPYKHIFTSPHRREGHLYSNR